jgi:hypothetical protein
MIMLTILVSLVMGMTVVTSLAMVTMAISDIKEQELDA